VLDVVVVERASGTVVDRIACSGEREANDVLRGIRVNMSPDYRADVGPHRDPLAAALGGWAGPWPDDEQENTGAEA
jgi:hypothetical protein